MKEIVDKISGVVSNQFPSFYNEEGAEFIEFVKTYYEYAEQDENFLNKARNLTVFKDVDTTLEKYLHFIKKKYMPYVNGDILFCKRMLIKHIKDVYTSKGSIEGLKLLFRVFYQEDIDVYLPGKEILKPSTSTWKIPRYLEIDLDNLSSDYIGKEIIGETSGARAFVDDIKTLYFSSGKANVVFIENIVGEFLINEKFFYIGLSADSIRPSIKGSVVGIEITSSTKENKTGDFFTPLENSLKERGLELVVSRTRSTFRNEGRVDFILLNGGDGYTLDPSPTINITYNTSTTGGGAFFSIGSLSNTSLFTYNSNLIDPVANVELDSVNYGPTLNNASSNTVIQESLTDFTVVVGSIGSLLTILPGAGYNGNLNVTITNPLIQNYHQFQIINSPAQVIGDLSEGKGFIDVFSVVNSGVSYQDENQNEITFTNGADRTAIGRFVYGPVGAAKGFWSSFESELNNKRITDSNYYNPYSYEIISKVTLEKYENILKNIFHPAGLKNFSKVKIGEELALNAEITNDRKNSIY